MEQGWHSSRFEQPAWERERESLEVWYSFRNFVIKHVDVDQTNEGLQVKDLVTNKDNTVALTVFK